MTLSWWLCLAKRAEHSKQSKKKVVWGGILGKKNNILYDTTFSSLFIPTLYMGNSRGKGRDTPSLEDSAEPGPCPHIQMAFEGLQGGRLPSLPGWLLPVLSLLHSKVLPHVWWEPPLLANRIKICSFNVFPLKETF